MGGDLPVPMGPDGDGRAVGPRRGMALMVGVGLRGRRRTWKR